MPSSGCSGGPTTPWLFTSSDEVGVEKPRDALAKIEISGVIDLRSAIRGATLLEKRISLVTGGITLIRVMSMAFSLRLAPAVSVQPALSFRWAWAKVIQVQFLSLSSVWSAPWRPELLAKSRGSKNPLW